MTAMVHPIAILPGDGIGHEVVEAAERVMLEVANRHAIALKTTTYPCGAFHYQATGRAIDPEHSPQ